MHVKWSGVLAVVAVLAAPAVLEAAPNVTAPRDAGLVRPAAPAPAAAPSSANVRVLIKAGREARIASQMNGRIASLPIKLGQSFRKGDLLVGFECDHQQAELAATEAILLKTEKTLESKKSLAAMKAVSDLDLQLAQADVNQAKAQADVARVSVRDCRISAPYDGSVVRVLANQWENVGPGAPLVEIVERGTLHAEALVLSTWLTWLKPGQRFTISVDELGREVKAEVTAVGAKVDPVSQTIAISAKIVEPVPGLRAGMSGNAKFSR